MATLPSANTSVQATAGAVGLNTELCCVLSPCAVSPDCLPRLYGTAKAAYAAHGYCEGVEYAETHVRDTGKSFLFVPLPIATVGAIGRKNTTGNTGTSVVDVVAGGTGTLGEHDGIVKVKVGGTRGTDQIVLSVSLDDGISFRDMRLGTASSLTLPYVNASLTFGAGTLVAGDTIITWHGSAPRSDATGWAAARTALAEAEYLFRSGLLCGDLQSGTEAQALTDEINGYETSNDRFVFVRGSVLDRLPQAALSHISARMTGSPTLTFAEVGAASDTITRSAGSWITDGFVVGDYITVTGAINSNNNETSARIVTLSDLVITLNTEDLDAEVATAGCTVVAKPGLVFAEVGASGDTITRNRGSWVDDGFRVGDVIAITGSVSNNLTAGHVTAVSATVLTLGAAGGDDLAAESISTGPVSIVAGQSVATWVAALATSFEGVTDEPRIGLSLGRRAVFNPFSGWYHRRPPSWAATTRSYQTDVHVSTWRKDLGPVGGSLKNADNEIVEYDDRTDGAAASASRFTSFRTYASGGGVYLSQDLTRAEDGSILSYSHNEEVTNIVCTTVQAVTENFIGRNPELKSDGTMTDAERQAGEGEVNDRLKLDVLTNKKNWGKRASNAVCSLSASDVLNVAEATVTTTTELDLNGTIHTINNVVRVNSAG